MIYLVRVSVEDISPQFTQFNSFNDALNYKHYMEKHFGQRCAIIYEAVKLDEKERCH